MNVQWDRGLLEQKIFPEKEIREFCIPDFLFNELKWGTFQGLSIQGVRQRLIEGARFFDVVRQRGLQFSTSRQNYHNPNVRRAESLHLLARRRLNRGIYFASRGDSVLALLYVLSASRLAEYSYALVFFREPGRRSRQKLYGTFRSRPPQCAADVLLVSEWKDPVNNLLIRFSGC